MRGRILAIAILASATFTSAQTPAPATAPPVSGEMLTLQGMYHPVSIISEGAQQIANPKAGEQLTAVVKGTEYRLYFQPDVAKDEYLRLSTADLTLDSETKTFSLNIKGGAKKGERVHGIYELKDGVFTICYGPVDKPRPAKFDAPAGSGHMLEVWKAYKR